MHARKHRHALWALFTTAMIGIALTLSELSAQVQFVVPPPPPKVTFVLKDRHGHAMPSRTHFARAGGGNTDVAQPRDDTLIIAMTGVVTAGPQPCKANAGVIDFDLNQEFEIAFADPKVKKAKLTIEAQVIGLLRGDRYGGTAAVSNGTVAVTCDRHCILALAIEGHSVCADDHLSINDHKGPINIPVLAGDYHLHQAFRINADHAPSIRGKAAAAEFGPDPNLDPNWISVTDPFHGANKKEFGFRAILHVEPE